MSYKMENRERKEIQLMRFIWVVRIKKKKKTSGANITWWFFEFRAVVVWLSSNSKVKKINM